MKRSGFSMIELVFVIVILGVLAAVAVPRFSTTRVDAQVATLRSDIATALKAVPARVFAENTEISSTGTKPTNPTTNTAYASWGEFILDTAGLDKSRWKVGTNNNGIDPIANKTGNTDTGCAGGPLISIDFNAGNPRLVFSPEKINHTGSGKALCDALKASYPSGSSRVIPLGSTGSVKF